MTTINGIVLEDHTGLVWYVVQHYKWSCTGVLESDDLFDEGMFGLMRAAEGFDSTLGYSFATYALPCIRQSVRRAIDNQARTVRTPVHRLDERRKAKQPLPPQALSLHQNISENGDTTRLDLLTYDEPEPSTVYDPLDKERVAALLDSLEPREREILRARFWDEMTLKEIGEQWGVCRERIRQVERDALAKLRQNALG